MWLHSLPFLVPWLFLALAHMSLPCSCLCRCIVITGDGNAGQAAHLQEVISSKHFPAVSVSQASLEEARQQESYPLQDTPAPASDLDSDKLEQQLPDEQVIQLGMGHASQLVAPFAAPFQAMG